MAINKELPMSNYTDINSTGGLDPRDDPQSDTARLARHRAACSSVHPDVLASHRASERRNLIAAGWTPPGPADVARPVGSIHKAHLKAGDAPWCRQVLLYSPDHDEHDTEHRVMLYTAGRLSDALDYAEKGLSEWRTLAQQNARRDKINGATLRIAIAHLHAVLNKARTHPEQQAADTAARDWLASIGSEPT
jgi:hypothetical protein